MSTTNTAGTTGTASTAGGAGAAARSTPEQRWGLALVSVASLMVVLDMLVVATALNTIRLDMGASLAQLEWTVNAFTLSFAILLMPASALGDRFGRRRLLTGGIGLFTAASAACALAPDSGLLITARAVQGAGAAMIMPQALALLGVLFPPERRARALGLFSGVTGLGTLGGPLLGGAVTQGLEWQWIFWLNVPIGLALAPLVRLRIAESRGEAAKRFDPVGLALVATGTLGLVWGLVRGEAVGWSAAETLGALAGGALLTAAFIGWELRTAEPMLPMRYFRSRAFSAGNASGFLLFGAMVGSAFFIAQFFQNTLGYGPLGAGLRMAPWTGTVFVLAAPSGRLLSRLGERPMLVGGLTLQGAGFAWLALLADAPHPHYAPMLAPLVLSGCGTSLAMPAAQNAVIGAVPRGAIGAASGVFTTLRQLGGTFGLAVLAAVFTASGGYASPGSFRAGFVPAIAVSAAFSLAAALAGAAVPGRREASEKTSAAGVDSGRRRSTYR
ncbi:MFS transporter [Phaeacidiphilus oryzae]|uniref:MFS transporter n=1 Tax=Phaeacidiphilus oryzae TaxID=348818 RepID=UPI0009FE0F4F|nr:MFS transporter [Phaeacidiphilus oryzae]